MNATSELVLDALLTHAATLWAGGDTAAAERLTRVASRIVRADGAPLAALTLGRVRDLEARVDRRAQLDPCQLDRLEADLLEVFAHLTVLPVSGDVVAGMSEVRDAIVAVRAEATRRTRP